MDSESQQQPLVSQPEIPDGPIHEKGASKGHGFKNYVCGAGAAWINIFIMFPVQKTVFRQQLHGVGISTAIKQLQAEGLSQLYRGMVPPLIQKTCKVSLMYGLYGDLSRVMVQHLEKHGTPELLSRSAAAAITGSIEAILTPFERVQTLLEDHRYNNHFRNTSHGFWSLVKNHGVIECYRGLVPILIRNGPLTMLFFGLLDPCKQQLPEAHTMAGKMVNDFVCGGVLGASLGTIFYPVYVIKTKAQAQVGGPFLSIFSLFSDVWKERGRCFTGLYHGATLNFGRSLISWGLVNATYELLLQVL